MAMNPVSILDTQFKMDGDDSIIDRNWYYGCLLSPRKKGIHNSVDGNDDYGSKYCTTSSTAENGETSQHKESNVSSPSFVDNKNCEVEDEAEGDECLISSAMFSVLDEDGDERVSTEDIMRVLEILNLEMPMEDVESAVKSVSKCGGNFLTSMEFEEFYQTVLFGKDEDEAEDIVSEKIDDKAICEAFGVFDQNGDGFISAGELSDILCRLGFMEGRDVSYCQSMIETVDFNGDGFVDLHEFRHLITRSSFPSSSPSPISCSS